MAFQEKAGYALIQPPASAGWSRRHRRECLRVAHRAVRRCQGHDVSFHEARGGEYDLAAGVGGWQCSVPPRNVFPSTALHTEMCDGSKVTSSEEGHDVERVIDRLPERRYRGNDVSFGEIRVRSSDIGQPTASWLHLETSPCVAHDVLGDMAPVAAAPGDIQNIEVFFAFPAGRKHVPVLS